MSKFLDNVGLTYLWEKIKEYHDNHTSSNPNLLDNWYFVPKYDNGNMVLPINQKNVSGTIATLGYFIDRWKLTSGKVQITNSGLVLNGTMQQILEVDPEQTVTATVLTTTGLLTATYNSNTKTFSVTGTGQTLIAAKLELGSVQTLAHQESGKRVLNDPPPDPASELAKCQRYFIRFDGDARTAPGEVIGIGWFRNAYTARLMVPLPTTMRTNPTIISKAMYLGKGDTIYTIDTIEMLWQVTPNSITVEATTSTAGPAGDTSLLRLAGHGGSIFELDANL